MNNILNQHAVANFEGIFYGARASLNVWRPVVYDRDFSLAQIWLSAGPDEELNTIEVGWIVSFRRLSSLYNYQISIN